MNVDVTIYLEIRVYKYHSLAFTLIEKKTASTHEVDTLYLEPF